MSDDEESLVKNLIQRGNLRKLRHDKIHSDKEKKTADVDQISTFFFDILRTTVDEHL